MRIRIVFKNKKWSDQIDGQIPEIARKEKLIKWITTKWVQNEQQITIEFDTATNMASVIPNAK